MNNIDCWIPQKEADLAKQLAKKELNNIAKNMYINFQNSPLYPQIRIVRRDDEIEFFTTLRKKHRNKWYLWDLYRKIVGKKWEAFYLDQIHQEVYSALVCGIIDPKLKDLHGMPIFRLDEHSQGDEESRVRSLIRFHVK